MNARDKFAEFCARREPAFPIVVGEEIWGGITMRDYIATKAMVGLLAARHSDHGIEGGEQVLAIDAYRIADAMLAERTVK